MSVSSLLSDARSYVLTLTEQAGDAMDSAIGSAQSVGFSIPNVDPVALPDQPPTNINLTLPQLPPVDLTLPSSPDNELLFQDIPPLVVGIAPTFDSVAPILTLPSTPSSLAAFDVAAPAIDTTIAFPAPPPELLNPLLAAPVLTERTEPTKPNVLLPAFDAERPVDDLEAPTDLDGTLSRAYRTAAPEMVTMVNGHVDDMLAKRNPEYAAQMARIEAQLALYLAGGTALNPTVEDAIYSRSRSKGDAEARRTRDTMYAEAAGRGFTMPLGALMAGIHEARQSAADNNAKAATDIAIAQAEMEQKNLQFAVTTSTGLRTAMVDASISYMQGLVSLNGQALEYAKAILGAVIETYSITRQVFVTKVEVYKADAMVYETKLRAAMSAVELYRAEIDALQAMTQVDRSKVDVYRARIEALVSLSNVYRSQIEAVQGRANLERLKLDVFQSRVQAYTALVQSKNAEWQGYSAAVDGQTARVKIFATQADAFNARINGYKATIDAQSEIVRAAALTNDSRARNFAAVWSGYQTVVQSLGEVARVKLENQRQQVTAFQAQVQAAVANAQVASEFYRATSNVAIQNAQTQLSAQVQGAASQRAYGETIARLGTANADIYKGLAGAALSGMNTLAAEVLQD